MCNQTYNGSERGIVKMISIDLIFEWSNRDNPQPSSPTLGKRFNDQIIMGDLINIK